MSLSLRLSAAAGALALCLILPGAAQALDDKQRQEIGDFIREYLVAHPEVLIEAQDALEAKQQAARQAQAANAVDENRARIFAAAEDTVLGNPKGDVTIVEFFDYNCGYCRGALPDMNAVIKSDPNVRFVLKEFPILGPESLAAHKVSAAFKRLAPEKGGDFHRALLGAKGRASEASAIEVAASLGVSEAAIRKEMAAHPNDEQVRDTYRLAQDLGITGTPSYILGNEAIFGAVGAAAIGKKVANLRSCGKSTC